MNLTRLSNTKEKIKNKLSDTKKKILNFDYKAQLKNPRFYYHSVLVAVPTILANFFIAFLKRDSMAFDAKMTRLYEIAQEHNLGEDYMVNVGYTKLKEEVANGSPNAIEIMKELDIAGNAAAIAAHYQPVTLLGTALVGLGAIAYIFHKHKQEKIIFNENDHIREN